MLVRSENRWLYRDVTRRTKNCSVWSAFELVLPLWWWPTHLSRHNSGGSATAPFLGMLCSTLSSSNRGHRCIHRIALSLSAPKNRTEPCRNRVYAIRWQATAARFAWADPSRWILICWSKTDLTQVKPAHTSWNDPGFRTENPNPCIVVIFPGSVAITYRTHSKQ